RSATSPTACAPCKRRPAPGAADMHAPPSPVSRRQKRQQRQRLRQETATTTTIFVMPRDLPRGITALAPDPSAPLPFPPPTAPFDTTADYIIDCTGLEADVREPRLLADLLDHTGAGRNPVGRLDVDTTFELIGTRSGAGPLSTVLGRAMYRADTDYG